MSRKLIVQFFLLVCMLIMMSAPSFAKEGREDVDAGPIFNNQDAVAKCENVRKKYITANPGREARWTGQWKTTVPGKKSVCGIRYISRSEWQGKNINDREITTAEYIEGCTKNNNIQNGWINDDKCRDKMVMNASVLCHTTVVDSKTKFSTVDNGRYIFVLRKNDNKLIIRKYDRSTNACDYDQYKYKENQKTISNKSNNHVRHSQLNASNGEKSAWLPVWSAGELWIEGGKITAISNDSGHFRPLGHSLQYVLETLRYFSIPVDKAVLYDIADGANKKALEKLKNKCFGKSKDNKKEL